MIDIRKGTDELEKNKVFIHYSYDHYESGSNLNFSIEFRGMSTPDRKYQTMWYGDNHEWGSAGRALEKSILIAKELLEHPEVIKDYFEGFQENVTDEGKAKWVRYDNASNKFGEIFYKHVTDEHNKLTDEAIENGELEE